MKLFRKLFAEKILRFMEGTNAAVIFVKKLPFIGSHIKEETFSKEKSKPRMALGIIAQILVVIWEFLKKLIYAVIFLYIPYNIISYFCPLVALHQERAIIYMFVMLSVISGSLANNTLLAMGDRDYLMIRVMLISPYMNFLGKFIYKIATEFIFYIIILCILKVSFVHSLLLCVVLVCSRAIGEMFAIISFDHMRSIYENRNVYNGIIMAVCVLLAYGMPLLTGRVDADWMNIVHPAMAVLFVIAGAGAMYFLWWYKHYRVIIREAMHMKRED